METPIFVEKDIYGLIHILPPRSIYHNDLLLTQGLRRSKPFSLSRSYWYAGALSSQGTRAAFFSIQ